MPAKAHRPTKDSRRRVHMLAAMGTRHEDICRVEGIGSVNTLKRHYAVELEKARPEANAQVAQALFEKALGSGQGSVTAAIFWLKCQAGWKETSVHEHVGADGGAIEVDARDQLAALIARQQEAVAEAAAEDVEKPPRRKAKTRRKVTARKKPRG